MDFKRGSPGGREEATEGEGESTWEDKGDGGVEPGRGMGVGGGG